MEIMLQLTQNEMKQYTEQGKTNIWQYNTLYQIDFSKNLGNGEYYLRQIVKKPNNGMGVTLPGRFIAMTPANAAEYR